MKQSIEHRIVDEDGRLVPFHIPYDIIRTEVRVWSGKNDFSGNPKEQEGIMFTHIVRIPDGV